MKQSMNLTTRQHRIMTTQIQEGIRLLQLSTFDLQQEIQNQIESNPMLEELPMEEEQLPSETSAAEEEDELTDFQWFHLYSGTTNVPIFNEDSQNYDNVHCTSLNLKDYLRWQRDLTPMTEVDRAIATVIIDAIDDNGFLTVSPNNLLQSVHCKTCPIDSSDIETVRHRIQHFDPIGCASYCLKEALHLQLEQLPLETPHLSIVKRIVDEHIDLLSKHNYRLLKKRYHLDDFHLEAIIKIVQALNPRPGSLINSEKPEHIKPDLTVKKIGWTWQVMLNPNTLPRLSINTYYASLIPKSSHQLDTQFLKTNLHDARWFLKSVQNRQETLLKVARYIVHYQEPFLEQGDVAMKPLIQSDVAIALGLHESTISRATTQKFIDTPRGLFELKYFFSNHRPSVSGGECSAIAIRAMIKKIIEDENPQKPLSDCKIAEIMNHQGMKLARRTVANYRESMGILPSTSR